MGRDGGQGGRYAGRRCAGGVTATRALYALSYFCGSETMRDEEKDQGRQGIARRSGQADTRRLGF